MRSIRFLLLVALGSLPANPGPAAPGPPGPGDVEKAERVLVVRAGRIHTVSRGTITDGVILVRAGKIVKVGRDDEFTASEIPPDAEVVEFPRKGA